MIGNQHAMSGGGHDCGAASRASVQSRARLATSRNAYLRVQGNQLTSIVSCDRG
jgi:hypothetical protein